MLTESLFLLRWLFVLLQPFTDGDSMNLNDLPRIISNIFLALSFLGLTYYWYKTEKKKNAAWNAAAVVSKDNRANSLLLRDAAEPVFQSVKKSLEDTDVRVFVSLEVCCETCRRNMFAIGLVWWEPVPTTATTVFGMSTHQVASLFCSCCNAALTTASRYTFLHDAVEALMMYKKSPAQISGLISLRRRFQEANERKIADLRMDLLELQQSSESDASKDSSSVQ